MKDSLFNHARMKVELLQIFNLVQLFASQNCPFIESFFNINYFKSTRVRLKEKLKKVTSVDMNVYWDEIKHWNVLLKYVKRMAVLNFS